MSNNDNPQLLKLLDVQRVSCMYLLALIDDITDLSKIELDKFSLNNEFIDLEKSIGETIQILKI